MCVYRKLPIALTTLLIFAIGLFLISSISQASTYQDVVVTASPEWIEPFTVTRITDQLIKLDWEIPDGYNRVMVRAKYGEYPEDPGGGIEPTDGYQAYFGTGTSANDTSMDLDQTGTRLYYIAFAVTASDNWSASFGQGYAEGISMTAIAESLDTMSGLLNTIGGNFLAFLIVAFVIVIVFIKKNTILNALGVVVSIVYGFSTAAEAIVGSAQWMAGIAIALFGFYFLYLVAAEALTKLRGKSIHK